ncbi:MAG TPA: peptidase M16, partial [Thiomicrospira sp.]|nr:peptidase M16 [Thiomicrospira sp.]
FDELDRIKDLMGQIRSSVDQGVTGSGHMHAMRAANQNFSPSANWQFERSGFKGIQTIKSLYDNIEEDGALETLAEQFKSIQIKLMASSKQSLMVTDENSYAETKTTLQNKWQGLIDATGTDGFQLSANHQTVKQAWVTSTQVNFCAKAFPAVSSGHKDAPKLAVLSACLRNGFLHSAVREKGGAYGGGAAFNADSGAFTFYSYRDPRLLETFADFDRAQDWLLSDAAKQSQVEEAILNVISSMDKPGSPAGEARKHFYQGLHGKSHLFLMEYRQGVLDTTLEQLREVAQKYLIEEKSSLAVLTSEADAEKLINNGFELLKL